MKISSPLSAGLQSYLTELRFFVYWISFLGLGLRHSNLLVALFFSNFPASHLFLYSDRLTLVQLSVFDCSVWVLWLLVFFDCISFNLCSSWSLWDSTPVNLPVTALLSSKTKPVDRTVDCFMHLACRPKTHAAILKSHSQADSYSVYFPPCGCSGYLADSNKLQFALWSSRVLKFPLCPWAPLVSVTHCLCTTKTQWCVAFWA